MAIQIKSFNQILGDMIRKIIAETPLNDINAGSVLLSLLEAAAANDYENNAAILNVLELLNIDAIKNNDLDAKAGDFGLERRAAIKASGLVNILNTNITKRSTGLYIIKPAPIAGQTKLYVNNTTGWASSGTLYIGRGTQNFEGPLAYSSITVYPTYSEITLSSALQKDHLLSDIVIDSQGEPDQLITAGTVVKIPANNQNPEVQYVTLRDAVIPSGEDIVTGVEVIAIVAGSQGNAGINTITSFDVAPFAGAEVTNTSAFSNGKDIETDVELRNRIKSYSITLARGTAPSIVSAVIGVSDPDDSKQVASAILTEPVKVGSPSILYIDDGSGFEPSFTGQSVDKLLSNATGKEEFLQLANYPVPRPQVINIEEGPFTITDGSFLRVAVDGVEETIYFSSNQFLNISAATLSEVIIAINTSSTLFKARLANNSTNILLYPVAHDAETIQVAPLTSNDNSTLYVNSLFKFPTDEFSYISLYQNNLRLREKAKSAELTTSSYAQWNITSVNNIIISVDGTPSQDRSFALNDFPGASSFSSLALEDWVAAFNNKFAGLTAEATPSQTMVIKSNKVGSESSIAISGGSLLNKWFANLPTESVGQSAQFELNRQTGNLRILTKINEGDSISAGIEDAKGFVLSSVTNSGVYNLSADSAGRPSDMVIVVDSTFCNQKSVPLLVGGMIDITNPSGTTMRIMSSTVDAFAYLKPGDFLYIANRSLAWLNSANTGLFKIKAKGGHTTSGVDSFVDVENLNIVVESGISVADSLDIKAFETDGFPQIWRASYLTNPPAEPITGIIASLNRDISGVVASLYKSNSIKITSNSEESGSIAIPISVGNAATLFAETATARLGNPTHIATRISNKSLVSYFKSTPVTDTNVFLDRHVYADRKGSVTTAVAPDAPPFNSVNYSEIIESTGVLSSSNVDFDDYISFTRGNNSGQIRTIKAKTGVDEIGTQQSVARTELDHVTSDEFELLRPTGISSDDSIVFVMDKDATTKTIDIRMSRSARVSSTFSTTEFSAYDEDNEPGTNFSNVNVWGTSINGTDFSDYSVWMRARNWYSTGGVAGSDGKMLVRAAQYGPNGEKLRFSIDYPTFADQSALTTFVNTPSYSTYSYFFGSGPARATALAAGMTMAVQGPYPDDTTNFPNGTVSSGNFYDYTFSAGSLGTVQIGDVISIVANSGISTANRGQFRVFNKSGFTVRVFNPSASVTTPGAAETTVINTVADVQGAPTTYTITALAGSLHQSYFTIYDSQGSVAVWYDIDNVGATAPLHGANRAIKVSTVNTGDSSDVIATKTAQIIALDNAFSVGVLTNVITIANIINGPLSNASAGTSGFGVSTATGIADNSLDGKYFMLYDETGSVAVWYDVGGDGTNEPFHGADRSIRISTVSYGDSANTVAAATATAINLDPSFSAVNTGAPSNVVTVTNAFSSNSNNASAETSGFTVSVLDGSLPGSELITNPSNINIFPLTSTTIADIVSTVNAEQILEITAVGSDSLTINKATREDIYTYVNDSTALAYGHNPTTSSLRGYISLYDGINWIKSFSNSNPNFTMKKAFTLNGVAPSIYEFHTAPNYNSANVGELFKLIPVSIKNVHHHLTQKALSQLPIVANVRISNDRKNIQITSKNLGSEGAIEIVGGNANKAQAYLENESEVTADVNGKSLLLKIPAFPDTFNVGDIIKIENDAGVKRYSRLKSTDSITITSPYSGIVDYNFNPKVINVSATTNFTITDVSSLYGRPAGFVWRWAHDGSATLSQVQAGDQVMAFGPTLSWAQGNKAKAAGDNYVAGLPIVYVNDASDYFDVINPQGKTMSVPTAVGVGVTFTANMNYGTFMPAAVNIGTNIITFSNTFVSGQTVVFSTTGTLPSGISAGSTYYIVNPTGADFQISNVPGGTPLSLGTSGSGSHTVTTNVLTGVSSVSGLIEGQSVVGVGIPTGAVISSIGTTTIKISMNLVGAGLGITVSVPNTIQICPTPIIKWNLAHAARTRISSMQKSLGVVTVVCDTPHLLNTGDSVYIQDSDKIPDASYSNITVTSPNQFTFATVAGGVSFTELNVGATAIYNGLIPTRYRLEKLGHNDLVRISRYDGQSPRFLDSGVAVDDYVVLSGTTFNANNNGRFRVLAVDNDSIIISNSTATNELNTIKPFNNKTGLYATWTTNTNTITGVAGTFKYLNIGDWVKKSEDPDSAYVQVLGFSPATPDTATSVTLGSPYKGSTAIAPGVSYNMLTDYDKGVMLQSADDIAIYEGDSAAAGDTLFVQNVINPNWFSVNNIGSFEIIDVGTNLTTYKPFLRAVNSVGTAETNRLMSVDTMGFYVIESLANKFYSVRQISHAVLDDVNQNRRSLYVTPYNRAYKFSSANSTSITHMGKLGYSTDVVTGIDGYLYYTGLLRRVQRIIDGFEPDSENFPGRRAVGSTIETLPPLNRRIVISVDVTTDEGVNLGDISNNIKSVIINYIGGLGVGQDVILSEIISDIMQIKGVAAVTFTNPVPSTERVTIADNEKATITPEDIGIA